MGLVLSRKTDESIEIDGGIVITIAEIRGDKVRLNIDAPLDVGVDRSEVADRKRNKEVLPANLQDAGAKQHGAVGAKAEGKGRPATNSLAAILNQRSERKAN